jgi:hypothetical protein
MMATENTRSFFDTIGLDYTAKALAETKARKQEELILELFMKERAYLSPDFVWMVTGLFNMDVPLTSVRRAITNLTDQGHLIKSNKKTMGRYGKPQYCWVYKEYHAEEKTIFNWEDK